jgi:hypothetical protein
MMINISNKLFYIIIFIILVSFLYNIYCIKNSKESFTNTNIDQTYLNELKGKRLFPFRYFTDINNNILPFVAITGFFRDENAKRMYYEYMSKGLFIFGITAYKSFPNKQLLDLTEGHYERNEDFNYTFNIKNWLVCFKDEQKYGFTDFNNILEISESDFYTTDDNTNIEKIYDFIYICNKDGDNCPLNGWNAYNRNFDLALKCFPIMINTFNLKGLVVGRTECGLEKLYGDKIKVEGWLDWSSLQQKMKESKMLFVPNIYDASPRVIAECLIKDVPVLMNKNILCGFKYINNETGEFFNDENDISTALINLLARINTISPKKWWSQNHSQELNYKKLRNFLFDSFGNKLNGILDNIDQVKFIL